MARKKNDRRVQPQSEFMQDILSAARELNTKLPSGLNPVQISLYAESMTTLAQTPDAAAQREILAAAATARIEQYYSTFRRPV